MKNILVAFIFVSLFSGTSQISYGFGHCFKCKEPPRGRIARMFSVGFVRRPSDPQDEADVKPDVPEDQQTEDAGDLVLRVEELERRLDVLLIRFKGMSDRINDNAKNIEELSGMPPKP